MFRRIATFLLVFLAVQGPLAAAELVMFERPGCLWCERWNAEIGKIYGKTAESCVAPLRRVDILQSIPDDLKAVAHGGLTPTFVLMDDGIEVGRIRGYPGQDFFWALLDELIGKTESQNPLGQRC